MNGMYFRHLVDVCYTEEEAKAVAAHYEVEELDEDGEVTKRRGRLTDPFPKPYANDGQARAANNGSVPPDLAIMVNARQGYEDYVFALLTGYSDPPVGYKIREGGNYNPYFSGGNIAMPPPLSDGLVQYSDGTKATISQMARDVATFMTFTANPQLEESRKWGLFLCSFFFIGMGPIYFWHKNVNTLYKVKKYLFK